MNFNIKGYKTPKSGENLCKDCRNCVELKGHRDSETIAYCQLMEKPVPMVVADCNKYIQVGTLHLYEMERMAWRVGMNKKSRKIGFFTPQDYHKSRYNPDSDLEFPSAVDDD